MKFTRWWVFGTVALLCAGLQSVAAQETYPTRPIRLIVQGAAGSGPDLLARTVARSLERVWKVAVVIIDQPGAGGLIAAQMAASADPDGYTLYVPTITTFVILPQMHDKLPFDLDRDFVPIGVLAQTPMMIAAAPSLGVSSLSELAALARKRPTDLFYAANNRGSLPHLAGELFRDRADAPITFVPYPGFAAGLTDLMGGRVSVIVESVGALASAVKAGTVRPLAVASSTRLTNYPEVPTVAEALPGFAAVAWLALLAPRGVPTALVRKISDDLTAALADPELARQFHDLGAVARPLAPADTRAFIRSEQERWGPVVKQLNLRAQ